MTEEEDGKCLTRCIRQNGRRESLKGDGMAKGQGSRADMLSFSSVPGTGWLLRADAVMPCLGPTVLSGHSGALPPACVRISVHAWSGPQQMTLRNWSTNTPVPSVLVCGNSELRTSRCFPGLSFRMRSQRATVVASLAMCPVLAALPSWLYFPCFPASLVCASQIN